MDDFTNLHFAFSPNTQKGETYYATPDDDPANIPYKPCSDIIIRSERYDVEGFVSEKDGKYYLSFEYDHKKYEYGLYPVKSEASLFIGSIALWEMEKHLLDFEMEEAYALCIKTKR